jgi:ferredoxin
MNAIDGGGKLHEVEFELGDDRRDELLVPQGETLLKAAEHAGFELRSGCRNGRCTSCTGRLTKGEVAYVKQPESLTSEQIDAGYVSLCVATPAEDCRVEIGDQVLAEAFPNLWKRLALGNTGDDE